MTPVIQTLRPTAIGTTCVHMASSTVITNVLKVPAIEILQFFNKITLFLLDDELLRKKREQVYMLFLDFH